MVLQQFTVRCFHGSSTLPADVLVVAWSYDHACRKLRDDGWQPRYFINSRPVGR